MMYIFCGDFNPPHAGHAAIIRAILYDKNPDKILILPFSENAKNCNISTEHRLKMLDIFVKDIRDKRVVVDDFFLQNDEILLKNVEEYLEKNFSETRKYVFGSDQMAHFSVWENAEIFQKIAKIFIPKNNENDEVFAKNCNYEVFSHSHFPPIFSREIREKIPENTHISQLYDDHLKIFKIPGLSNKISLYILENRLYRAHLPKEKLLVHVCCGPDVVMPILQLKDEYEIICFWYDPNIQPKSEYDKRYEAFKKVCEIEKIPFIKGAYDVKNFFSRIKWFEFTPEKTGEKCTRCYDMRMFVAAKLAKRLGIGKYTTSLNTSPKKDLDKMFFMGHKYAEKFGITFLDIPFRKRGGFAISAEYTKENDIYRQNYCGCIYSIREGGESDMKRKMVG